MTESWSTRELLEYAESKQSVDGLDNEPPDERLEGRERARNVRVEKEGVGNGFDDGGHDLTKNSLR
jgi:hypothetical protein